MPIQADIIEEILQNTKDFERYKLEREFRFTAKQLRTSGKRIIKGIASTTDKDRVDDIITFNALKRAEKDLLRSGSNTVFFNHNKDHPIGKVLKSNAVRNKGLEVEIQLSQAKDVDDVFTKIEEGILNSLSIGGRFKRVRIERDSDGRITSFKVLEIELFEVSVVGLPANPNARITSVSGKSLEGWTKMTKSIKSETSEDDNDRSSKMTKKTKTAKKNNGGKNKKQDDDDDDDDEGEDENLTRDDVKEMIQEEIAPLSDSIKSLSESIGDLVEGMQDKDDDEDESDEDDEDEDEDEDEGGKEKTKSKKTKKGKKVVSKSEKLLETIVSTIGGLQKDMKEMKKDKKKRKGFQNEDNGEDDDDEENEDAPKKVLKNIDDEATVKYVGYIMHEAPEEFENLNDNEKKKLTDLYYMLMIRGAKEV